MNRIWVESPARPDESSINDPPGGQGALSLEEV